MDRKSISFLALGLVLGALVCSAVFSFLASGGGVGANTRVLKLAHGLDTSHPVHLGMVRMKERLEELSSGSMTIDIYPSGVLGSEVQCIEQLQSGVLAMSKTSTAAMESFIPELGVFGVPYLFRDEGHFWNVLDSEIGHDLLAVGESTGLRGLCYYDAGSRNFYSTKKPIREPRDLVGMKIRVQNSRMAIAMVEALGGSPTPIAWGELYSSLAQGVVDGAENNPPSFESSRHYEVCKYFTPDAHTRVPDLLMIGTKVWNSLSEEQRAWLQAAADESSVYQRELWAVKTRESLEAVQEAGVEIVDCDPALFQAACEPIRATLEGTPVAPWLAKIEEAE
ncbi:TRAP transporter substrate-binding protein [Pelagicoccus sp. SDUM812003]|uniref:TRAP transporter substrate-binding protein n=1 Tax=Pelagicoccus sp. SDUM812003 TaxID=3041267 RepID=UPI00280F4157|nr:TRAP transporter substrate-binding protein [Pelagicoccus sp. SDUM812003]MDQ8205370.1 TRAP transporter substrate-binding protein [Pelagicoccus sp. SDUM812003]